MCILFTFTVNPKAVHELDTVSDSIQGLGIQVVLVHYNFPPFP